MEARFLYLAASKIFPGDVVMTTKTSISRRHQAFVMLHNAYNVIMHKVY